MNLTELKVLADQRKVDVLVSLRSHTCKPVIREHRQKIETECDSDGVYYTEDHESFLRIPAVILRPKQRPGVSPSRR